MSYSGVKKQNNLEMFYVISRCLPQQFIAIVQPWMVVLQARDDDFVPYKEGKALYDTLLHLTEGALDNTEGRAVGSGKVESEVQSSELVTISGGHCTGFMRAPSIMPDAVVVALERLRAKHGM